jgi:hypothetical protein
MMLLHVGAPGYPLVCQRRRLPLASGTQVRCASSVASDRAEDLPEEATHSLKRRS